MTRLLGYKAALKKENKATKAKKVKGRRAAKATEHSPPADVVMHDGSSTPPPASSPRTSCSSDTEASQHVVEQVVGNDPLPALTDFKVSDHTVTCHEEDYTDADNMLPRRPPPRETLPPSPASVPPTPSDRPQAHDPQLLSPLVSPFKSRQQPLTHSNFCAAMNSVQKHRQAREAKRQAAMPAGKGSIPAAPRHRQSDAHIPAHTTGHQQAKGKGRKTAGHRAVKIGGRRMPSTNQVAQGRVRKRQ
jgi:hypothetical protein